MIYKYRWSDAEVYKFFGRRSDLVLAGPSVAGVFCVGLMSLGC